MRSLGVHKVYFVWTVSDSACDLLQDHPSLLLLPISAVFSVVVNITEA